MTPQQSAWRDGRGPLGCTEHCPCCGEDSLREVEPGEHRCKTCRGLWKIRFLGYRREDQS